MDMGEVSSFQVMDTGRWREPSGSLSATMSKKEESQQ
jgi:hypothetical protein